MKVIYLTDIHDDLKDLRFVIQNTEADIYIISGDLIYKAFFTEEKLYGFLELQDVFYKYIARHELDYMPYELALEVLSSPEKFDKQMAIDAAEYRILFQQAATNMKEKYQTIKELLEKYARAHTILLPGNYDMDLQYTPLYQYDLHKKETEIDNVRFAGYGGAPIVTPGIPEMLAVVFHEENEKGKVTSEAKDFFTSTHPDVLVIHNPAYGTLDRLPSYGHCGSFGIRDYIDDNSPSLVLSGHVHEDYGLLKTSNTYCLNPSNFGGVDTPSGFEPGGYFSEFEMSKNGSGRLYLRKLSLMRVVGQRSSEVDMLKILDIKIDKNLRASEHVVNVEEFTRLGRFLR